MKSNYSVEQLNSLFSKSKDAVFFMERVEDDYQYHYLNAAAIKLINKNPIGETVLQVNPPQLSKNILYHYQIAEQRQEQVEFEDYTYTDFEVRKQKTSIIPVNTEGKPYLLVITREVPFDKDLEDNHLFMRSYFFETFLSTILVSTEFQLLQAEPAIPR